MGIRKTFSKVKKIKLPGRILNIFLDKALRSDIELGGILVGKVHNDTVIVDRLYIGENIVSSPVRFEIDPDTIVRVIKELDEDEDIVGIIHSHPASPYPSIVDLRNMELWPVIWIIIDSNNGDYMAWYYNKCINIEVLK
jgi:proteasome lid subunit RPN8/RPN11